MDAKQREYEKKFPKLTAVEEIDEKVNKFTADMQEINAGFMAIMTGKAKPSSAKKTLAAAQGMINMADKNTNRSNSRTRLFNGDGDKHTNQRI